MTRRTRSLWSIAKWAENVPPSEMPTRAGGSGQVCAISAPSQSTMRDALRASERTSDRPRPGRSGTTILWSRTRWGITGAHAWANAPWPCSSTRVGPCPPWSTGVEIPARSSRCSVTGRPRITAAASRSAWAAPPSDAVLPIDAPPSAPIAPLRTPARLAMMSLLPVRLLELIVLGGGEGGKDNL